MIAFEKREDGVLKDDAHLISPACGEPLKEGNEVGCQKILLQIAMRREDVKADRILFIRRINQNHVIRPAGWDDAQNLLYQIAMRIKDRHTFAALNILPDEIKEKGRLAGAARPYDMHVLHALFRRKSYWNGFSEMDVFSKEHAAWILGTGRSRFGFPRVTF